MPLTLLGRAPLQGYCLQLGQLQLVRCAGYLPFTKVKVAADECSRDSQFVAFAETDEDFLDHKSSVKASGTRDDG
jgi:hypothetical protein